MIPADSVLRSQAASSQASFSATELNSFVKHVLKLEGDLISNLNETLDAIIDGRIVPNNSATIGNRANASGPTASAPGTASDSSSGAPAVNKGIVPRLK